MTFVNVHGEVIDMRALAAKAPAHRAILGPDSKKRKPTIPKGYAALPGSGPEGKTCRDCIHKQTQSNTGAKSWIKCDLMRAAWTHGPGSDIRAGSPACRRFEPKAPPTKAQGLNGSPARQGARPDGQDGISAVKDLSASASPATKEQQ